ncbi:MAG: 5'/3'-nucleotidase SurE [Candidatus Liberibacter ctenarytainae]|uniref:5'-nucleotidase SurE n=1 Tax=Candidatus Liberibacter ctenarytainae TaxID=2020335 RepID=A0A937AIY2_9HYPH|nr:5'/3'-nucleotidase SurE [Candidatus Liberibacter ctenarytainae]
MRILLTNDDGIKSEGLVALEYIARTLSDDIWVFAPETDQSCLANSLTMSKELSCRTISEKHFAVSGTPVDCVVVALHKLSDKKPDLILSGVNIGTNTANHVAYSGTMAAAFEGGLQGIRSCALSQSYKSEANIPWEISKTYAPSIIRQLLDINVPNTTIFNINFPSCSLEDTPEIMITEQGKPCFSISAKQISKDDHLSRHHLEFCDHLEDLSKGSDVFAVQNNMISVTPIKTDLTDYDSKQKMTLSIRR